MTINCMVKFDHLILLRRRPYRSKIIIKQILVFLTFSQCNQHYIIMLFILLKYIDNILLGIYGWIYVPMLIWNHILNSNEMPLFYGMKTASHKISLGNQLWKEVLTTNNIFLLIHVVKPIRITKHKGLSVIRYIYDCSLTLKIRNTVGSSPWIKENMYVC